jgi:hypothetical protein
VRHHFELTEVRPGKVNEVTPPPAQRTGCMTCAGMRQISSDSCTERTFGCLGKSFVTRHRRTRRASASVRIHQRATASNDVTPKPLVHCFFWYSRFNGGTVCTPLRSFCLDGNLFKLQRVSDNKSVRFGNMADHITTI